MGTNAFQKRALAPKSTTIAVNLRIMAATSVASETVTYVQKIKIYELMGFY